MANEVKQWSHGTVIDYECARETIGDWMGILTAQIYEERKKPIPDENLIVRLRQERMKLSDERRTLRVSDHANVERINKKYGSKVRAWRAGMLIKKSDQ